MTAWSDAAFATLTPRPRIAVSAWADRYREIAPGTSYESGPWRTDRVPYAREPMDAISDPAVERVVCMWSSQAGKSELALNAIGYYVHQDPSPILFVRPTEGDALSFVKERIDPMFRASPALRGLLSEAQRDKDNTLLLKQFPGGYLAMAWATSSVSLASRPIRVVIGDEVDKWEATTGKDGDPWHQAVQRTSNFPNRKIIAISTPTIDDLSPIQRLYEDTDRRRLWVPCPRCGAFQVLEWEGVIYKRDDAADLDDVHYRCAHCAGRIEERDRPAMLAQCEWKPDNPGHPHRGYQLSALYSPWVRWRELAAEWIKAWADRDRRGQQEFINLRLGEPWTEGSADVNAESLEKNREDYAAVVPLMVLLLTCGVDVQDNRLEIEVLGWGKDKESWGIQYHVIPGDTSTPGPWQQLDAFLSRTWARADGSVLDLWCVCIDSGGHRTSEVYSFCKERERRNVLAVKGRAGEGHPIAGKPTQSNQARINLYPIGVDVAKAVLFSRLAIATPGPGYCHFPRDVATGYDGEYFKGLCSERLKVKNRGGKRSREWVQIRPRNEPLDCRVYAMAAREILTVNEDALTKELEAARAQAAASKPVTPQPAQPRKSWRVLSRGVQY